MFVFMSFFFQKADLPPMHNGLCIISFSQESRAAQERLVTSILNQNEVLKHVTTRTLLLGSHDQVPTLPRHAVYMAFVARHARHIILEHPEEDLGSLRHTVVKKLLNYGGMCIFPVPRPA